ncbi:MAG TPA: HAD family hydrolase [Dehalococcoidia bacterium]|nr:HAD family hydrolase [Dehalococcoidia bacterium]
MIMRLAQTAAERTRSLTSRGSNDDFADLGTVLFDLDGTLVDSEAQVAEAACEALKAFGHDVSLDQLAPYLGPPLVETYMEMLGVDREEARTIYQEYLRIYMTQHVPNTQPISGAEALLDSLRDRGLPLALVTNKVEELARAVVEVMGWEQRFGIVVGADTTHEGKPGPAPALHALDALAVPPGEAVLVGDSPADMGCAVNTKLLAGIAVPGFQSADRMREAGATHFCADLIGVRALLLGV